MRNPADGVPVRRFAITALLCVVVLTAVPGVALAETRAGGSVIVEAGETVNDDLRVFGGSVTIEGTVRGNVTAVGGTVWIDGTVDGDVSGTAGTVVLGETGRITGRLAGTAETVIVQGTVEESVSVEVGTTTVASTAVVGGDLRHGGPLDLAPDASIGGEVIATEGLFGVPIPAWLPPAYVFASGLLAGVALLIVFPDFSTAVATEVRTDPLRSGGAGLFALFGVPVVLVLLTITLVGLPLAVIGTFGYAIALWIGSLYGRYAIGTALLSRTGVENRWIALLGGFLVVAALVRFPLVGDLLHLIVLLLGLGGVAEELFRRYQGRRDGSKETAAASRLPTEDATEGT